MRPVKTERDLDDLRRAAQGLAVIAAWGGAGVFEALRDGAPRPFSALPASPRALAVTAPVLVHLGLVVRVGADQVALTRSARALLEAGSLGIGRAEGALGDLARLDGVLRSGEPLVPTDVGVRDEDREATRAFLGMLFRRSAAASEEVARWLGPRLPAGARVLDLGGGHGRYADALAAAGCAVTVFDRPVAVELARERFGDRLAYRAGDFLADELGGPYEAALLSNIVHGLDEDGCRALLGRVHGALAPGGLLVLKDMFVDEHGAHPVEAAFFNVTMLLYTRGGCSHAVEAMRALCAATGFEPPEHLHVADDGFSLLLARRA